jgi:hypothetical protein
MMINQEIINSLAACVQELHAAGARAAYDSMLKIYEEACRRYAAGEPASADMLAILEA